MQDLIKYDAKVSVYSFKQNKNMLKNVPVLLYTYFYNFSLNVLRPTIFNIYNFTFFTLQISVKLLSMFDQKPTTFPIFWAHAPTELQFSIFFSLICSQPRDQQNRSRDLLLSIYFLNNLLLTVFMHNTLSKLVELLQ